ncbi:MAG TPA: NADH-quinone oxidoreductase subunit NuoB [Candidatus Limnocylindrales bacterium]|nr:NADH-quinone oxidoreductase subunit NuoB [Candidatus Limnocylindrales bacterium]
MFEILRKSLATGVVTTAFPRETQNGNAPVRRGRPEIDFTKWKDPRPAATACPTGAIEYAPSGNVRQVTFDLGKCTFCGLCAEADDTIHMTGDTELSTSRRRDLISTAFYRLGANDTHIHLGDQPANDQGTLKRASSSDPESIEVLGPQLKQQIHKVLGRSLHIREVDAGSCNGCEIEIVGLNSPIYDIERFGIHFVASPRHADMLLVTGPVSRNMELALRKTYDATPAPRLVVAVGACGCSGGIFGQNYACLGGVDKVIPVDVYIPGCPPNPYALLQGILMAVGRYPRC